MSDNLYLIIGLGNPGREYDGTRHNVGFTLVEQLANSWRANWELKKKFNSRLAQVDRDGRRIVLCEPQTYMNSSGEAVQAVSEYYKLPAKQILILADDADLPLGTIRLRPDGSSGGHHGLESIEQHLGTRAYARLKIGIGRGAEDGRQISGFVLGRFAASDKKVVEEVLGRASQQVECWLSAGVQEAMNKFNGAIQTDAQ
ncbi:MAG: aminoacyl-tRNA hydrolase [Limisphaerales bacterium]